MLQVILNRIVNQAEHSYFIVLSIIIIKYHVTIIVVGSRCLTPLPSSS